MRVLIVSGSLPPAHCGVGDYVLRLARALAEHGIETGVLTSRGAAAANGVKVLPVMSRWSLVEAPLFVRALRGFAPDVIHFQFPTQGYRGLLPPLAPLLARAVCDAVIARSWHEVPGRLNWPAFVLQAAARGPYVVVRPEFERQLHPLLRPLLAKRGGGYVESGPAVDASALGARERAALKRKLSKGRRRLIAYFGFLYRAKGVERLFEICDPQTDHLLIVGGVLDRPYARRLEALAAAPPWAGQVTFAGFAPPHQVADILAAADAVVLPFRRGAGVWNSSLQAAMLAGAPVVATSARARGFDAERNVVFTAPDDLAGMRAALAQVAGRHRKRDPAAAAEAWRRIAARHAALYRQAQRPAVLRVAPVPAGA